MYQTLQDYIDDVFLAGQSGVLEGGFVQQFRLLCVYLEEGMGRNGKGEFAQLVMDEAGAPDDLVFLAHDYVGMPGIDVLDQSGETGNLGPQQLGQFLQVGHHRFVGDEHRHHFPGFYPGAAHNVTDQALPAVLFQRGNMVLGHPLPGNLGDFVVGFLLNQAVFHIDDLMGSSGKAANPQLVVFALCDGHLHLVPVMPGVKGSQGVQDLHLVEMANPFQGIYHGLPFIGQLGRVGQMLELAAPALLVHRAGRFFPVRGGYQYLYQLGLAVALFYQGNLGLHPFPRQGTGNKEGEAADFAHSFAGAAQAVNGAFDIFFGFKLHMCMFHSPSIIPVRPLGRNRRAGELLAAAGIPLQCMKKREKERKEE